MVFPYRGEGIGGNCLEREVSNFSELKYDSENPAYAHDGLIKRTWQGIKRHGALGLVGLAGLVGVGCEGINQNTTRGSTLQAGGVVVAPKNPLAGAIMNIFGNNIAQQGAHESNGYNETQGDWDGEPVQRRDPFYCFCSNEIGTDKNYDGTVGPDEINKKEVFKYGEKIIISSRWEIGDMSSSLITMLIKDEGGNLVQVNTLRKTKNELLTHWQLPFNAPKGEKGIKRYSVNFEWNGSLVILGTRFFVDYNQNIGMK